MSWKKALCVLGIGGFLGGAAGCAGLNGAGLNLNASSGLGQGGAAPQINGGAQAGAGIGRGTGQVRVNSGTAGSNIGGSVNQVLK